MKKIYFVFLICCLCGCTQTSSNFSKNYFIYEKKGQVSMRQVNLQQNAYDPMIELSMSQISHYNQNTKEKTNALYDIEKIDSLSKETLLSMIQKYKDPILPKYDGNRMITQQEVEDVLQNRNLEATEDNKTQKGIITQKTDLKAFPTDLKFYSTPNSGFDNIQESELHVNTPVLILHESMDHEWYFVMAPIYVGWVSQKDVANISDEDLAYFQSDDFILITEAFVDIDGVLLEMSVKLPYLGVRDSYYLTALPKKGNNGFVEKDFVLMDSNVAYRGYLPYNQKNVEIQAFKYENVPYSWGGSGRGIDCSGFVSNVYGSFGFTFPRNTDDQEMSLKERIDLQDKNKEEKLSLIPKANLLYQPGHVMLVVTKEGKTAMIHASGHWMKVICEEITLTTSNLEKINGMIHIHE